MNIRAVASGALFQVVYQGNSLTEVLQAPRVVALSERDQSWVRNLCFGCVRWHVRLTVVLERLLSRPLKKSDRDVECLLRTGLYQLMYQRTPDHAAVNETVDAARRMKKKPWAGGLVNGVLRNFIRQREAVLAQVERSETGRYAFPRWLARHLKQDWPTHWRAIMEAGNAHPPLVLRVNQRAMTAADYQARLQAAGIEAILQAHAPEALVLEQAVAVASLPGFDDGLVSVQDAAAQLAARLLACEPEQRVLDACAAPGGKTCHLLECNPDLHLLALDSSAARLEQVRDNLRRLQLQAVCKAVDAGAPETWWDGQGFDRILLDAPCSATGVIRRHPDIKVLRRETDIAALVQEQARLLAALWGVLKPGGQLLYVTCSVLQDENEGQLRTFTAAHPEAEVLSIRATWGMALTFGRQILPGDAGMDGFYYALLKKAGQESTE
ncbi:MAG TPA: 16S rRNA (cytosine(967)-C(5))-methyltransferase RsmB [Thiolinea sp.]|nr:16S rRNA (cytosine(967)-C(5))-methyltransferase RsmB [Thiolinea sp.]